MSFDTPTDEKGNSGEFCGLSIYYSGSIKGTPESDPEFPWKLVQYMAENGANVLSEHVAARDRAEMEQIRTRRTGKQLESSDPWYEVRRQDNEWIDAATHFVGLVNSPSHGVGMEIERALYKQLRGLNITPILCLVRADLLPSLSYMIRGISSNESPYFYLRIYTTQDEAQETIHDFLLGQI